METVQTAVSGPQNDLDTNKLLHSANTENARRDRLSNNQKVMKALILKGEHIFLRGNSSPDFHYLPLQQALYAAGYRLNGKKYSDAFKRVKAMEADYYAIKGYDLSRDENNLHGLLVLINCLEADPKMGNPTKRRILKAAIWYCVLSAYMKTSQPGASQQARTEGQKALFGSAIKAEDQNKVALMLQTFQFGEIMTTGKSYAKDASGKSIGVFKIYRFEEAPESSVSSLFEYFNSIGLSFAGINHTEQHCTTPQTLLEEYRLLLDLAYAAYTEFQHYCLQRKEDETNNRKAWNEQHPEFKEAKVAEREAAKAAKELAFKEANKLTAYRKAQIKAGYAVVNPNGEYVKPRLDAFLKEQFAKGYKKLDEWGNIKDTGKRIAEVNAAKPAPAEQWLIDLLDPTLDALESPVANKINSEDTTPRMSLEDMRNYDPEPVFVQGATPEQHLKNLKAYSEAKKAWDMRHLCDDMEF